MRPRLHISPALLLVCSLFMLAGVLRLNELSMYNPDSTRYLIWGNSIAHGKGFVDATQPEPDRYVIHAPLYALLVAPAQLVGANSLVAAKIESIVWGVVALVLFSLWLNRLLGNIPAIAGMIMLAAHPLMLLYSTEVLSEVPFLAVMLAMFLFAEKASFDETDGKRMFAFLLVCASILPLLREAGAAIALAVALGFAAQRKPQQAAVLILGPVILSTLWFVRNNIIVTPSAGSQSGNVSLLFQHFVTQQNTSIVWELVQRMWLHGKEYFIQLSGMLLYPQFGTHQISLIVQPSGLFTFIDGAFQFLKYLVVPVGLILVALGVTADYKRSGNALLRSAAGLLYIGGILLYPIHDLRFLFPLLPLMIFYVLSGAKFLYHRRTAAAEHSIRRLNLRLSALFAILLVPNVVGIAELVATNLEYQKSPVMFHQKLSKLRDYPPLFAQPWTFLASWIRQRTEEDVVIASSAKDIAPMVENRKVLELDPGVPLPEFERILRDNGATYLISPVRWDNITAFEFQTRESRRLRFETVYSIANLRLLKIHSSFLEPAVEDTVGHDMGDSLSAGGLLKRGRALLMAGNYRNASEIFARGLSLAPFQPDLLYNSGVAYAFLRDTVNAVQSFRSLLVLPQAGSYLYVTRKQLEALDLLRDVSRSPQEAEMRIHEAASIYWNLGYPVKASALMDSSLNTYGSYFVGLLWGFHYAFQRDDINTALVYVDRLKGIDSTNAVVLVFQKFLAIRDSLRTATSPDVKSRLHLSSARLFRQIELFEESIDEGERAFGGDQNNGDAAAFLVESYEAKRSARGMMRWLDVEYRLGASNGVVTARLDSLRRILNQ